VETSIEFKVNGFNHQTKVKTGKTLADVLRNELGLTGTKVGCNTGSCGSCTVIMDGKAVLSCILPVEAAGGKEIVTIEGLAKNDRLDPLQEAFVAEGAIQCGFCTPGMVMSAKALLLENPSPVEEEIRTAMAGNLCRCTGYNKIIKAVQTAAEK